MGKATLVIGPSGSGKTFYAKSIAKKFKSVYIVNGSEVPKAVSVTYGDILQKAEEGCLVIFDDLIQPSNEQIEVIKKMLLFEKRHNDIEILILLHSVTGNRTFGLLQHVDTFILTKSSTNTKNYTELCRFLKVIDMEEEFRGTWKVFLEHELEHVYLKIDQSSLKFDIVDLDEDEKAKETEKKRKRVLTILSSRGDPSLGMALYDHIFSNFPIQELDPKDLSLQLENKISGVVKSVNICDLLYFATVSDSVPNLESVRLYKQFSSRFSIPNLFVKNEKFRRQIEHE